jgi:hypothetical protein
MVTKKEREVYEKVLDRDRWMTWQSGVVRTTRGYEAWLMTDPEVCMAPIIDSSPLERCFGAMERDHVHSHTGGTKGKRAPTTMATLVILCHRHHQDGWATSHRPEIREYIIEANERYRAFTDRR